MYTCIHMYMYSRRHNKVSVPFLLPFRFLEVLPFFTVYNRSVFSGVTVLLPFVTVYNRSVLPCSVN